MLFRPWRFANSGQVSASISVVALSFIVHDPSGIMVRSRAKSRSASVRKYRNIAVSLCNVLNIGCVRNSELRFNVSGIPETLSPIWIPNTSAKSDSSFASVVSSKEIPI